MTMPPRADAPPPRALGFWMCTALVIGNTIGMGIFLLPAGLAPYGWNAMLGWGVTVLGCIVVARVFALLAQRMPDADGPFAWIRATLGARVAFGIIWCYWISVWVTLATLAVGVVGYLGALWPVLGTVPPVLLSLAILWLFVGVSLRGVVAGGRVQVATTLIKLLPLLAVIVLGLWLLVAEPTAFRIHEPRPPISVGATLAASTIALFAMLGIESAAVPAGSVRDPARTIPRATLVGTVLTGTIYVIVCAVPMLLLPGAELAASSAPFADVFDRVLGAGSGQWLAFFVVVSGLGALNGWTLLAGELTRTMARHGTLPALLADSNQRGAPRAALLLMGALASAMVAMSHSGTLAQGFVFLTTVVTAATLPLYFGCALALFVLWRQAAAGGPASQAVVCALAIAYVVLATIGMGREALLWALALCAAGLPVYAAVRWRRGAASA
jgi:APA family basic amino acid/polyamine antiporter